MPKKQTLPSRRSSSAVPAADPTINQAAGREPSASDIANFGALLQQGRHREMEVLARDLIVRYPDHGISWKALCMALQLQGRAGEALAPLQKAAILLPYDAEICYNLGSVLLQAHRLDEAEQRFRRALAINPHYVPAHFALGMVLQQQARPAESEACYRGILALDGSIAEAHNNLGVLLMDQARHVEAEACFRDALERRTGFAEAYNNLGLVLKEQGRLAEACTAFEAALAHKPDFIHAHFSLSTLKTYRPDEPYLASLERLQGQAEAMPLPTRVRYWFALGKLCEDAGRYDESFFAYREGNRLQHAQLPVNEAAEDANAERIIEVFGNDFFASGSPLPADTAAGKGLILIVGMPRSGTTLLEQILASYPGVQGVGETADLPDAIAVAMPDGAFDRYPDAVPGLEAQHFLAAATRYAASLAARAPGAACVVDKTLSNFLFIGMLHRMLPQAKIIQAMRDPMDTCFSSYSCLFDGDNLNFTYDLGALGRCYRRYARLMRHWHAVLPSGVILDVRYEEMVADTEGQARRLLDFIGLPWDAACLDFHRNQRTVKTVSAAQVRKPIYQTSLARWKRFEKHLSELQELLRQYDE